MLLNATSAPRGVFEVRADGKVRQIGTLAPGEQMALDTFLTHPWMVGDVAGFCSQIFVPGPGTTLGKIKADGGVTVIPTTRVIVTPKPAPKPPAKTITKAPAKPSAATVQKRAAKSCSELGLAFRNGQCVAKAKKDVQKYKAQKKIGCPAGTYLNPLGVCQGNETGG